ncbi:MAG TPA: hypothetical protein VMT34_05325 [Aggregatilineales bacterium]|nr:hypothetical protein [Aggregatilineales bacterium]
MTDKPIFIYNTSGDWMATAFPPHIFDTRGEYVGFIDKDGLYTRDGEWVGILSKDGRILRKRAGQHRPLHPHPLPRPAKPTMPGRAPLPPQNAEISFDTIDVLEEDPDVFKRLSDRRKDLGEE